jgi:hypothetical protein
MEELKLKTDRLDQHVEILGSKIDQNTEGLAAAVLALSQMNTRQDRTERNSRWVLAGAVLLLGAFLVLGWVTWQQHQTSQRLSAVVDRSLCPLYGLIVGSYNPETRQLNTDGTFEGSDRQKYIQSYQDPNVGMFAAADALECKGNILVPPAKIPR